MVTQFTILWIGIMMRAWRLVVCQALLRLCSIISYVLHLLAYCSLDWGSAAKSHLWLLDRVFPGVTFLLGGVSPFDLSYRP